MEKKWKPFKKKPSCPKCGGKDIAISYHEGKYRKGCAYNQECRWLEKEHQAHYCRICSFEWFTKVLALTK